MNVDKVVKDKLCTGCGICMGVCPAGAIEMVIDKYGIYTPKIAHNKCIDCGLCLKVCPGLEFDYVYYMEKIHGKLPDNVAIGPVVDAYAGYTTDDEILTISQSGGFVSSLLIYGLEQRLFDGAVVTSWDKADPFKPKVYIARNREEVLESVGSKYNPIPVASIAKDLRKLDGKFVFVGTSCQIQGMRKAEEYFPELSEKIVLYIGLHCLKVFNYHYHDQILFKIKKSKSDINYFRFRDKAWRGWPCDMRLTTTSGEIVNLTGSFSRLEARSYFSNWRCQLCFDKGNEFSDVSCGDCRIPRHYGAETLKEAYYSGIGKSDIIARTQRGRNIIRRLVDDKVLIVEKSEINELITSIGITQKKLDAKYAEYFITKIGKPAPYYGIGFDFPPYKLKSKKNKVLDIYSKIAIGHYYLCHCLMRYQIFRKFLKMIPHKRLGQVARMREKHTIQNHLGKDENIILERKK